jgi:hypothetical protein
MTCQGKTCGVIGKVFGLVGLWMEGQWDGILSLNKSGILTLTSGILTLNKGGTLTLTRDNKMEYSLWLAKGRPVVRSAIAHPKKGNQCLGLARTVYTPYMTVYLMISLPKGPYIHRIYMVLANPIHVPFLNCTSEVTQWFLYINVTPLHKN